MENRAQKRLDKIKDTLQPFLQIQNAKIELSPPNDPLLIPYPSVNFDISQTVIKNHLKWMIQKQKLGQDVYFIAEPGPFARQLALLYCQLTGREVEYVVLSRDVTDGDLKQKREIVNNSVVYIDQQCVRAAIHGRVLILDGIHKAERNVLPLLNNLLENREMELENNRFLTNPKRYDLLSTDERRPNLVRVSENFQVIAIGLPVPKFAGYPLDPPFRSRFQARYLPNLDYSDQFEYFTRKYARSLSASERDSMTTFIDRLLKISFTLRDVKSDQGSKVVDFTNYLDPIIKLKQTFMDVDMLTVLKFCYPMAFAEGFDDQMKNVCFAMFNRFGVQVKGDCGYQFKDLKTHGEEKVLNFKILDSDKVLPVKMVGGLLPSTVTKDFIITPYHSQLITELLMSLLTTNVCLVGEKGVGKSILVRYIANLLGYTTVMMTIYRDMSTRDFLQKRDTDIDGNTVWKDSQLVEAALNGYLCILDPIECLLPDSISFLHGLLVDHEATLPNGNLIVSHARFNRMLNESGLDAQGLNARGFFRVHPSFRVVAIGKPFNTFNGKKEWINSELLTMFLYLPLRSMTFSEEAMVITKLAGSKNEKTLKTILSLAESLRQQDSLTGNIALSTRQVLRICKRIGAFKDDDVYELLLKSFLFAFLPLDIKTELIEYLLKQGIVPKKAGDEALDCQIVTVKGQKYFKIGSVSHPVAEHSDPNLVPNILFYQNQKQLKILQNILKDYKLGEHILVIGSQGVGKNKIIDYFLQMLNLPREYIQLHRDTTVSNLTISPTIIDGKLKYEDSALVRAVRLGHILVVDEVDKAPTYVTSVLKSLVDDGEMVLADGRRIVTRDIYEQRISKSKTGFDQKSIIVIHESFRMILLANKPGFPFLGNDFYREIGDVFATHSVENPDFESELALLKNYGKDVSDEILNKLIVSFQQLRKLVDEETIRYPYSTRELVNVVKHLQEYPEDGMARALHNVFDFDRNDEVMQVLKETMGKNGIPIGEEVFPIALGRKTKLGDIEVLDEWKKIGSTLKFKSKESGLKVRGVWKLNIPPSGSQILKQNGRETVFSELLFTFSIGVEGFVTDLITDQNGTAYIISVSQAKLFIISADQEFVTEINLNDYIPANRGILLSLQMISPTKIAIHNSQEHSILVIDLNTKFITTNMVSGLDPTVDSIFAGPSDGGDLSLLYQPTKSAFVVIDHATKKQHEFTTGFAIKKIAFISKSKLIITSESGVYIFDITTEGLIGSQVQTRKFEYEFVFSGAAADFKFASRKVALGFVEPVNQDRWNISGYLNNVEPTRVESSTFIDYMGLQVNLVAYNVGKPFVIEVVDKKELTKLSIPVGDKVIDVKHIKRFGFTAKLTNGKLLVVNHSGECSVYEIDSEKVQEKLKDWRNVVGTGDLGESKIIYGGGDVEKLNKELEAINGGKGVGKGRGSGEGEGEGEGSEEGSGGTSGSSGSGGAGGPASAIPTEARESGTIDENFEWRKPGELPKEVSEAQKELHFQTVKNHLRNLDMSEHDFNQYAKQKQNVKREIAELGAFLDTVEAKNKERIWIPNQTSGELDETRLVDGLTGDRAVYKMRGEENNAFFFPKPKRIHIIFDLSASMMRFNGYDQRMDRSLDCAVMFMEAFKHKSNKFDYRMFGHSGDGPSIELVGSNSPTNDNDIYKILVKMKAHAQYCMSGDNTINAITTAIKNITKEEGDDYIALILSDANLQQYNITENDIHQALHEDDRVNANIIFIGKNDRFKELGSRAHTCLDTKALPKIIKSIFLNAL